MLSRWMRSAPFSAILPPCVSAYIVRIHRLISPQLLTEVEQVAALRERIQSAVVDLAWIPALRKDTRTRNVHASTAIEGNPLTLEQVRALEEGRELSASGPRHKSVLSFFITGSDEYYGEDRPRYYAALAAVRNAGEDLTGWLEYCAEGLKKTIEFTDALHPTD